MFGPVRSMIVPILGDSLYCTGPAVSPGTSPARHLSHWIRGSLLLITSEGLLNSLSFSETPRIFDRPKDCQFIRLKMGFTFAKALSYQLFHITEKGTHASAQLLRLNEAFLFSGERPLLLWNLHLDSTWPNARQKSY